MLGDGVRPLQRRRLRGVTDPTVAACEQSRDVERDAGTQHSADPAEQRRQTATIVDRNGHMRALVENSRHQSGEHGLGSDLDENARAVRVHGLDLGDEFDRLHQVFGHLPLDFADVGGVRATSGVAVHGGRNRRPRRRIDQGGERLLGGLDEIRMEGGGNGKFGDVHFDRAQVGRHRTHGGVRPGNHALQRGIVVGQHHAVDVRDGAFHALACCVDCRHRAEFGTLGVRCVDDEAPTRCRELHQRSEIDGPCGMQRHEFAVAMSGEHVRLQAQRLQQAEKTHLNGAERGLRDIRTRQALLRLGPRRLVVRSAGKNEPAERGTSAEPRFKGFLEHVIGVGEGAADLIEVQRDFARHVRILGSLAREHHSQLARGLCDMAVENAGRNQPDGAGQVSRGGDELGAQIAQVACDDHQRVTTPAEARCEARRNVAHHQRAQVGDGTTKCLDPRQQRRAIAVAPDKQLSAPGVGGGGSQPIAVLGGVLFEHHVEIRAAEAKCAARRPARLIGRR